MDDIDIAQYLEECERSEALRRVKDSNEESDLQLVDREHGIVICLDCDAPIPKERLAVQKYAVRCIDCQREYDREQRLEARLYADSGALF
jgi:RNA polymerase-binding transcription factor DksA